MMMMAVVVGGGDGGDDVGDRIFTAGRAPRPRWCLFGPQGDDNPGHAVPMAIRRSPEVFCFELLELLILPHKDLFVDVWQKCMTMLSADQRA